jgi:hypothetical protein
MSITNYRCTRITENYIKSFAKRGILVILVLKLSGVPFRRYRAENHLADNPWNLIGLKPAKGGV